MDLARRVQCLVHFFLTFQILYLAMHCSDCNDNKNAIVLQTVRVLNMFSSLVPRNLLITHSFTPRTFLRKHRYLLGLRAVGHITLTAVYLLWYYSWLAHSLSNLLFCHAAMAQILNQGHMHQGYFSTTPCLLPLTCASHTLCVNAHEDRSPFARA